ncbi:serine/threonine-protein kinase [Microbacterium mcarthurae (nom. nud.)]|uniref:Protein kinase domain-containing protein n=1 Tax=Microbacterium mcarthurae TaxID=3035918 RepID=A0ABW9GFJ5_9MICO
MARRSHTAARGPHSVRLRSGGWVHFDDSPENRIDAGRARSGRSSSRVVEGAFEAPWSGPVAAAVKIADGEDGARSRLRAEIATYRNLHDLPVVKMLGYRRQRHRDVLVLERGMFSLDDLLSARPTDRSHLRDPLVQEDVESVIGEIATMAGASLVRVLRALAAASESRDPSRHGDIRLENLLMVDRDGVLQVVVGDWGSPARTIDVDADIEAAGIALWELLHDGHTPFTLGKGTPALRRDDPRLTQQRHELVLDTDACNDARACALDGAHDADGSVHGAAHRLAVAILHSGRGDAPRTPTEIIEGPLADAVVAAGLDLQRAQVDGEYRTRPAHSLARLMAFTDVAVADAHGRGWMPPGPPPRSRFGVVERAPRDRRALPALRRLTVPARLAALLTATAVGVLVGYAASTATVLPSGGPISSAAFERAASLVVGAGFVVLGLVTCAGAWFLARGVPRGHRAPLLERWSPVSAVAGFVTASIVVGTWAAASLWSPPTPAGASTGPWPEVVALGAAVAAVGVNAVVVAVVERTHYVARLRRGRRERWWMLTAATTGLAVTVVIVGSLLAGSAVPPTLVASAETLYTGMPGSEPAFFNPDAVAVAEDGSTAVLERYADEADVVWIKRPTAPWAPEIRIPHKRTSSTPASEVGGSPIDALAATLPGLSPPRGVPAGDRLTSLNDLGFLDPRHVAVIGAEGVSVIDLTAEVPVARIVDASVRADAFDRDAALAVVDDGILVTDFDHEAFEQGHPEEFEKWKAMATCPDAAPWTATRADVVKMTDPLGDARVAPPTWKDPGTGADCRRNAWTIVADGSKGAVIERTRDDSSAYLAYRPLDDRPSVRLTDTVTEYVGPGVEHGGRLLVEFANCLQGFALDSSVIPLPRVADRSWYTTTVDDDVCRKPEGTAGFIGADVDVEGEPGQQPTGGSDNSSTQAQPADTCVPPRAGVSVLDLTKWAQKPLAVRPDGSILIAAPAAAGCSAALWSLDAKSSDWMPEGGVLTERKGAEAATMLVVSPESVNGGAAWFAPGHWAVLSDDGSSRYPWSGETTSYRALTPRVITTSDATVGAFGAYSADLEPDIDRTKIVIDGDNVDLGDFEVDVPGIRDLAPLRTSESGTTSTVVMALCDGIFSFDPTQLGASPETTGWFEPSPDAFRRVAGDPARVVPGDPAAPDCGQVPTEARDAHGEIAFALRPTAVDAVTVGDAVVVAYAEAGTFAGQRVSRVRVIDPDAQLADTVKGDVAYTLGCDEDTTYDGTCLGDLDRLGLEASDIAISDDGSVAVSTTSAVGWGPVLLFRNGERRVVRLDPGMLASGVAWSGDRLVVTDAARGDVVALSFPG